MRRFSLTLIAALLLAPLCAQAQTYSSGQFGAVGSMVTATDTSGTSVKVVMPAVTGGVAAGATDSGNPVKVGCVYNSTLPTYTNGQRTDCQAGTRGSIHVELWTPDGVLAVPADGNGLVTQNWAFSSLRWNYAAAASGIVNTTTAVTIKAAAGASTRNYIDSCQIDHDLLGAATELVIRDGAAGTVLIRMKLQTTAAESRTYNFDSPLKGTANTLLEVATLTAVTGGVYVNCQGHTGT